MGAALLDADGTTLTWVGCFTALEDGSLSLDEVDEPEALLGYYFGRGGRQIMMDLVEGVVRGQLVTRWDGDRRSWWIEIKTLPQSG